MLLIIKGNMNHKYDVKTEQDYAICLKLLLEYNASPALDPTLRMRENKKRPTSIFQAVRSEKMLRVFLEYVKDR